MKAFDDMQLGIKAMQDAADKSAGAVKKTRSKPVILSPQEIDLVSIEYRRIGSVMPTESSLAVAYLAQNVLPKERQRDRKLMPTLVHSLSKKFTTEAAIAQASLENKEATQHSVIVPMEIAAPVEKPLESNSDLHNISRLIQPLLAVTTSLANDLVLTNEKLDLIAKTGATNALVGQVASILRGLTPPTLKNNNLFNTLKKQSQGIISCQEQLSELRAFNTAYRKGIKPIILVMAKEPIHRVLQSRFKKTLRTAVFLPETAIELFNSLLISGNKFIVVIDKNSCYEEHLVSFKKTLSECHDVKSHIFNSFDKASISSVATFVKSTK